VTPVVGNVAPSETLPLGSWIVRCRGKRVLSRDGETLFREKSVDSQGEETGRATLVFEKQ
jgi:hypothetical protein